MDDGQIVKTESRSETDYIFSEGEKALA